MRADAIDDYIRVEMARQNVPGLALAIMREGRIVRASGYGFANIELVEANAFDYFAQRVLDVQDDATLGDFRSDYEPHPTDQGTREQVVGEADTELDRFIRTLNIRQQNMQVRITNFFDEIILYLGLMPQAVLERGWIWQPATYMFLHAGAMHILFNMLGIWMFGVELERMWGTQFFARYYAITGVGAGLTAIARWENLRSLDLTRTAVTSRGVAELVSLKNLERLNLTSTAVDDAGVQALREISSLQRLWVFESNVADANVEPSEGSDAATN